MFIQAILLKFIGTHIAHKDMGLCGGIIETKKIGEGMRELIGVENEQISLYIHVVKE